MIMICHAPQWMSRFQVKYRLLRALWCRRPRRVLGLRAHGGTFNPPQQDVRCVRGFVFFDDQTRVVDVIAHHVFDYAVREIYS